MTSGESSETFGECEIVEGEVGEGTGDDDDGGCCGGDGDCCSWSMELTTKPNWRGHTCV